MTASEDQQLQPRPRPTEIVEIAIATDAIDSLKQIAIDRDMSIEALLKFYIGQGLRQDLAKQSADTTSNLNLSLLSEEVQKTLTEAAEQTGETREAIALQWLIDGAKSQPYDPLEEFIGAFDGGGSDWADQHDLHLSNLSSGETEKKKLPSRAYLAAFQAASKLSEADKQKINEISSNTQLDD